MSITGRNKQQRRARRMWKRGMNSSWRRARKAMTSKDLEDLEDRTMITIFLDIDGVLNSSEDWKNPEIAIVGSKASMVLNRNAVIRFKVFLEEIEQMAIPFTVVLSSSWRFSSDHVEFLAENGIIFENMTFKGYTTSRDNEILRFCAHNKVPHEKVLILDDDTSVFLSFPKTNIVNTMNDKGLTTGFTSEKLEEALNKVCLL